MHSSISSSRLLAVLTRLGPEIVFLSLPSKTMQDQALPSHIHGKNFHPNSTQFRLGILRSKRNFVNNFSWDTLFVNSWNLQEACLLIRLKDQNANLKSEMEKRRELLDQLAASEKRLQQEQEEIQAISEQLEQNSKLKQQLIFQADP